MLYGSVSFLSGAYVFPGRRQYIFWEHELLRDPQHGRVDQ